MSADFYPLKFQPIYKDKIWGGTKIYSILGKDFSPLPNCGESWELSGVQGNVSIVANGSFKGKNLNDLVREHPEQILGSKFHGELFPLLIKFLDAKEDLSLQVHPNDRIAKDKHAGSGKTEMWYIIDADPEAKMYVGFKEKITHETFLQSSGKSRIMDLVCTESVSKGDVFYIPAGRIHSIGKGILLAEIQQTSDITYRIYDFDRIGDDGHQRVLHINEAAEAINYDDVGSSFKTSYDGDISYAKLVESSFFNTWRIKGEIELARTLNENDSFRIYVIIEGNAILKWEGNKMDISKGDVILIPACLSQYTLQSDKEFCGLEVFLS